MADELKILGQLDAASATEETLYTVPDLVQTTCTSLVVCNRNASAITFRLRARAGGEATDNKQFLFYDQSVSANKSYVRHLGMTLEQASIITTYASTTGVSFTLFGIETK